MLAAGGRSSEARCARILLEHPLQKPALWRIDPNPLNPMQLEEWVEQWVEIPDDWTIGDNSIAMSFGPDTPRLKISGQALLEWQNGGLLANRSVRLVPHCGVEGTGFAEYIVDLEHLGQWPRDEPLRFRLGESLVRLGAISAGLSLFLEPHYRNRDYLQDEFFERWSSIQIVGAAPPRETAISALFYINADYLREAKESARIHHLVSPTDAKRDSVFLPSPVGRKRVRNRTPILGHEPARLFVAAASEYGDSRFLGFYRVLEFFFGRARMLEISAARKDPSVSDGDLIKKIKDERGEPHQLRSVLRSVLRPAEARMLVRHLSYHKLAQCKTLEDVSTALYAYRNAIVHAKEEERSRTRLPDPFVPDRESERWHWIVEYLAARTIRRLGT